MKKRKINKGKIGRNAPCTCGSGKKHKKCCLDNPQSTTSGKRDGEADARLTFERMQATQEQIVKQQGQGRPIISEVCNGYRFVSSGARLHGEKEEKWKTFHDFLFDYLKDTLGRDWGAEEQKKLYAEQHPIIQWHAGLNKLKKDHSEKGMQIQSAPMIGGAFAILSLSYNLFLLEHNVAVQKLLIERLKSGNPTLFYGALYETYVAAIFIRAGFTIEIEDESDPTSSHCEFVATSPDSKTKYSIEAKARLPFKKHAGIGKQLGKALAKDTPHKRVIFIDVNIPKIMEKIMAIEKDLKDREVMERGEWKTSPPAYVFVTNHSYAYDLKGTNYERMGFAYGYKIDYFKADTSYSNLRDARLAREKHKDMGMLIKSMNEQNTIPVTFDGDIPEFAFNDELRQNRLLIGNRYIVPIGEGDEKIEGLLESATVVEAEKRAYAVYLLANGRRATVTHSLSDEEMAAYKKHKETFFGIKLHQGRKTEDPLDFYDFMYDTYKITPREKLLEWMSKWPNFDQIKDLDVEELRVIFCEQHTTSAMQDRAKKQSQ